MSIYLHCVHIHAYIYNISSALTTYACEADGDALQPCVFTYHIAQNFGGENFGKSEYHSRICQYRMIQNFTWN